MTTNADDAMRDKLEIREVIESWAIWRDTGDFERLAGCYHDDATMNTAWFRGPASVFVERARANFARGNTSTHVLGASAIDVQGERAVAQTRVIIGMREMLDGALYDIACQGRFYDLFEQRHGRWAIVERQPTYEKDRADPVIPGRTTTFDEELIAKFPPAYQFLAYALTKRGAEVMRNLPGLKGPEVEALYARGRAWLGDG